MERRKKYRLICQAPGYNRAFLASRQDAAFHSPACRQRASRAGSVTRVTDQSEVAGGRSTEAGVISGRSSVGGNAPPVEFGPNRIAVEDLAADLAAQKLDARLDGALLTAARELASEVDRDSDNSPLWGRYQTALEALRTDTSAAEDAVTSEALWQVRTAGCTVPTHATTQTIHCARCCENDPNAAAVGRWLYADDGAPLAWIPSDEELRRIALDDPGALTALSMRGEGVR